MQRVLGELSEGKFCLVLIVVGSSGREAPGGDLVSLASSKATGERKDETCCELVRQNSLRSNGRRKSEF